MRSIRIGRIAAAATAATVLAAGAAPSAGAATTVPARLSIGVAPKKIKKARRGVGTPVKLRTKISFDHPADSRIRLQRVTILLPSVGKPNGRLFPACNARTLNRARGRLSACPRGSKVGSGIARGRAVDIGVASSGRLTFFNGPRGKSLTLNVSIINPARINATFKAPIKKIRGRFGYRVTFKIPAQLQTILDGPIVVDGIDAKIGATRKVRGVKRGFIEALRCPRSKKAPGRGTFDFSDGSTSSANAILRCR